MPMPEVPLSEVSPADALFDFPCAFPLKIMGRADAALAQEVLELVRRHDPGFDGATMEMRASSGGKYVSLTCTITAVSRAHLDGIYRELSAHPLVKVVL
jgi:putative lipoic acid-binding regulatory protein